MRWKSKGKAAKHQQDSCTWGGCRQDQEKGTLGENLGGKNLVHIKAIQVDWDIGREGSRQGKNRSEPRALGEKAPMWNPLLGSGARGKFLGGQGTGRGDSRNYLWVFRGGRPTVFRDGP